MVDFVSSPTGYVLELEDGVDKISFIANPSGGFALLDGTFLVGPPKTTEAMYEASKFGRQRYISRSLDSREVSFSFRCSGATAEEVVTRMNRVAAMLERSQSALALSGGKNGGSIGYSSSYTTSPYSRVAQTGDQGLILRARLSDLGSSSPVYTTESNVGIAKTDIVSYRVYFGNWAWDSAYSIEGIHRITPSLYAAENITITLTCAPYATGDARVVYGPSASTLVDTPYPLGGSAGNTNKVTISAANIIGSSPALARISARENTAVGTGVIVARDTEWSIWNTGSVPYRNSDGAYFNEIRVVGWSTGVSKKVELQILQLNPVTFKYRVNGGSWSGTVTPSANTRYSVGLGTGSDDIGVVFSTTDFSYTYFPCNVNDIFTIANHQAPVKSTVSSLNMYSSAATLIGSVGTLLTTFAVNIPPHVSNRYKVIAPMTLSTSLYSDATEIRAGFLTYTTSGTTAMAYTNWMKFPAGATNWLCDLGMIDMTPTGMPGRGHPGAHTVVQVTLYARTSSLITSACTLTPKNVFLLPAGDEGSYLVAKWSAPINNNWYSLSNFDPDNPYIAYQSRDPHSIGSGDPVSVMTDLDTTTTGGFITLIPGVDNTVMAFPLFSAVTETDYRKSLPSGTLYDFTVAIRPRFLFVGS